MNMNAIVGHQYLASTSMHGGMLETVLDHTPVPVAVSRLTDNQLLYVNKECREMFADGAGDRGAGESALNFWCYPEQREMYISAVRKNGRVENFEACLKTVNGQQVWALISAVLLKYEEDLVVLTSFQNITHLHEIKEDLDSLVRRMGKELQGKREKLEQEIAGRKQALSALENSRLYNRELTENSPDCIMELDCNGCISYMNSGARYVLGDKLAEKSMGTPWVMLWSPLDKPKAETALANVRKKQIASFQCQLHHCWFDTKISPVFDAKGCFISILVISRDITVNKVNEEALRKAEERNRLLLESTDEGIFGIDAQGRTTFANPAVTKMLGYSERELIGQGIHNLIHHSHEDGRPYHHSDCPMIDTCLNGAVYDRVEEVLWRKDNTPLPVSYSCSPICHQNDERRGAVVVFRDNTKMKGTLKALRESHDLLEERVQQGVMELLATHGAFTEESSLRQSVQTELQVVNEILDHTREGVTISDADGTILRVNRGFTAITGYSAEEVIGRNPRVLKSNYHDEKFYRDLWQALIEDGQWAGEIWNRRKGGEIYPEWLSIGAIKDLKGNTSHYVAVFQDTSDMKEQERRLNYQAYHDALTTLPNKRLFMDRLRKNMENVEQRNSKIAVINLDLDDFKNINDSMGHLVGDKILKAVAERLVERVRTEDTVARFGGDEFMIMAPKLKEMEQATDITNRIRDIFGQPFQVNQHQFHVTGSIGVTIYPDDGNTPDTLVKNAEIAMYGAKEIGRNNFRFFTASMNKKAERRMLLENSMRQGLIDDEFIVFFQPKMDLATNRVCGMEALVRWLRKDGTIVSPMEFIVVAEETGLIIELGYQVLEKACRFASDLAQRGSVLKVSVNLSSKQFVDEHLAENVALTLKKTGLAPECLELEVTETSIIVDIKNATKQLEALARMGISIAVDDFGTGYSSLYYLKNLPLKVLKVDQSFIRNLPTDPNDAIITSMIITLGKQFGLTIVAEGVENEEQLAFLKEKQCDQIQGYLFAKPMAGGAFVDFLHTSSSNA